MQTPGGARVFGGGEMLGVAQSRFVLAQAQKSGARGGGFKSQTVPQRAGEGRVPPQDSVEQSEAGARGEKGGGALLQALRFEARPCRKRPRIQWALQRARVVGRPPARARCRRRAGRRRREKRIGRIESHALMMA